MDLEEVLEELLDYAVEKGVLKENSVVYRDLFDTKIMNCLVRSPAQVIRNVQRAVQRVTGKSNRLLL